MSTERTPLFYMANLGPEVKRYFGFLERGEVQLAQSAKQRVLGITQKILTFESMQSRRPEIEILVLVIENPSSFNSSTKKIQHQLENYFTPFALRLMAK